MRPRAWAARTTLAATFLLAGCVEAPQERVVAPAAVDLAGLEVPSIAADSVQRRAQEVTVRVRSVGCTAFGLGSGFLLPGGVVVTNRHVVDQPREVTISTWDGRSLPAQVAGVATDSDLALLEIGVADGLPEARLRTTPVVAGEEVFAVGYPGGGRVRVTPGRVLGTTDGTVLGEPSEVIRVEVEITQGSSGGPLVDSEGRVVGVVFAIEVDAGVGLAVPVEVLLERLDGAELVPPAPC